MRVYAISDLHGILPEIEECDIVLICGDISPLMIQRNGIECKEWLFTTFANWVNNLPCDKVVLIAGNHDHIFQSCNHWINKLEEATNYKLKYLENSSYDYLSNDGRIYKIYGTPACHTFGNWAFMYSDEELKRIYSTIPRDCDIIMSHDAPYGCSDILLQDVYWNTREHIGNKPLAQVILDVQPKYLLHGHLHSSSREFELLGNSKVINCSILDEYYKNVYDPIVLNI